MSRIINFIKINFWEIFLLLVVSILCASNFTPNTFLTGWDNLHPEFDILTNIKRSVFSTWQEYQGLGLLAGMAHASDLVRQLIILPFTFVLPINLIRYFWHFSMILLGSFGAFKLSFYVTKNKYSSLIASLFYLLNFGSVQYFHFPFEPYSTFWGFFAWLVLSLLEYLNSRTKSNLIKLFIFNLLATPSFYVQTVLVVYFISILLILLSLKKNWRTSTRVLVLLFLINSFWLMPNIFFSLTKISVTQNATQNIIATDQFIEQNQYRGNLSSFLRLQNQYYDLKNQSRYLMETWWQHFSNPEVSYISIFFFILIPFSFFYKITYRKIFVFLLIFGLFGFLCSTFPFSFINNLFRQIPILNQILRNSFTKLVVPTVLSLSILIGISLSYFKKLNLLLIPFLIYLSFPSFTGNYISPKMRRAIPPEYFQMMEYLKTQDTGSRIAELPQYNYWGWYNYNWGYVGSGFTWYGVDQPITSRTFDVWDNNLEEYYWQLHYAIIKHDSVLFTKILDKYNISYVFFDDNVNFPEAGNYGKVKLENQKLVNETAELLLEKQFGNLKLYRYQQSTPIVYFTNFITSENVRYRPKITTTSPLLGLPWKSCLSSRIVITAINQESVKFVDCGNNLPTDSGYLLKIHSKNISSRPLLFKIFSLQDNRLIIDSKLTNTALPQYILLPPIYPFDLGIGINFSSFSLSNKPSINELISVEIAPVNFNIYQSLIDSNTINKIPPGAIYHPNQSFYKITPDTNQINQSKYIVLPQSFDRGWIAFYFDCKGRPVCLPTFLTNHLLVNNWANGWSTGGIPSAPTSIYLFFWPQILEFAGLLLIPLTFLYLFFKKHH